MLNDSSRTPLVIDGDLRTITVPTDYVFGVYNDKDVLAVPFVCPRYMDDIDLSELSIRVNFTNSTGTSSYYDVPSADVTINTDTIEFTWLLGSAVFTGSGEVTFAVCLRKVEEDGRIAREFNTTLASAKVLEGLEVENQNDPAQYSILTALQSVADSVNSSIESADEYAEQLKNYVGSPLVANTSTDMVDVSRIYVYTGNETGYSNGHWYYYNNAAWHDGGNYNAVANGIYPDLTAGNVLLGRTQSDSAPYLLRKTGDRLNKVGYSCYETIVGASVGWNQLVRKRTNPTVTDGDKSIAVSDGKVTITVTGASGNPLASVDWITLYPSHKYLIRTNVSFSEGYQLYFVGYGNVGTGTGYVINYTGDAGQNTLRCYVRNSIAVGTYEVYPQVTDLTAELGSSIADYIYSLESATAGAGVAKLREWGFCTGYAAYNAGSIESVEVTDKVVRGFNAWDEECELGAIGADGVPYASNTSIRSKNFIPVIGGATYYYRNGSGINQNPWLYDANQNFISRLGSYVVNGTFTVPSGCSFIKIALPATYGTVYKNDICINISSDRNGEYEPYHSTSYPLGNDTLRGIFKLDASNNLYADGDVKTSDGTITRKYGIVDLGTLDWISEDSVFTGMARATVGVAELEAVYFQTPLCSTSTLIGASPRSYSQVEMGTVCFSNSPSSPFIRVRSQIFSGLSDAEIKTALTGVYLLYEKQTPTTEQSTPFTSPQTVYPDGTEEFVTTNNVPVGHETNYPYDMKSISEELLDIPDVPSTNGTYVLKATRSASGLTYTWVTG